MSEVAVPDERESPLFTVATQFYAEAKLQHVDAEDALGIEIEDYLAGAIQTGLSMPESALVERVLETLNALGQGTVAQVARHALGVVGLSNTDYRRVQATLHRLERDGRVAHRQAENPTREGWKPPNLWRSNAT